MTWRARFITPATELGSAPTLRREFVLDVGHGDVRSAELAVTALGVVEATVNAAPASAAVLTPGWTSYE
ncbi:alpha-L-rhamnosidase N-terminal domain-containing protein, partial [Burkholderia multivorans]|uniref:alpha-L-rhamnosidase N-terminal domain-containing protein n=1 Tax=Burkholderia multivorans TaxID=87883 RepID=UPI0031169D16